MGKKYFIIYETTNLINSKVYRGKHWTYTPYEFDGYLGSGKAIKAAIKKYGRKNFSRETLFVFEDEKEAYLKEKEIVTPEFVNRKDTYNMCVGGKGVGSGENNHRYGVVVSEETRAKQSVSRCGEKNGMFGRRGVDCPSFGSHHTEEFKVWRSVSMLGEANPMFGLFGEDHPSFGLKRSEETLEKQRVAQLGKRQSWETRIKKSIANLGSAEIFYQRLRDIQEADKARGWKTKLAKKWEVSPDAVTSFLKRWGADIERSLTILKSIVI